MVWMFGLEIALEKVLKVGRDSARWTCRLEARLSDMWKRILKVEIF